MICRASSPPWEESSAAEPARHRLPVDDQYGKILRGSETAFGLSLPREPVMDGLLPAAVTSKVWPANLGDRPTWLAYLKGRHGGVPVPPLPQAAVVHRVTAEGGLELLDGDTAPC